MSFKYSQNFTKEKTNVQKPVSFLTSNILQEYYCVGLQFNIQCNS